MQSMILYLIVFLILCAVIEVVLPEGAFSPYVRFFIGLLTILFLMKLGKGISVPFSFSESPYVPAFQVEEVEEKVEERVLELLKERVSEDIMQNYPGCTEVRAVSLDKTGAVLKLELVVNSVLPRSEIARRYGLAEDNVILRGVNEP